MQVGQWEWVTCGYRLRVSFDIGARGLPFPHSTPGIALVLTVFHILEGNRQCSILLGY